MARKEDEPKDIISSSIPLVGLDRPNLADIKPKNVEFSGESKTDVPKSSKAGPDLEPPTITGSSLPLIGRGKGAHLSSPPIIKYGTVSYSQNTKASIVYLSVFQLLPYERLSKLFSDMFNIPINKVTIYNSLEEAYDRLEPFEAWAKLELRSSEILLCDETGVNVNGKRQ
ncbi:MAG: transposase, partial [Deltaproteobacteria bacterium]|nr:transposase [Deltaproteobacteria bacterium]